MHGAVSGCSGGVERHRHPARAKRLTVATELGGEAAGDAALRALFAGYEGKARSLREELPKMLPAAYNGIDLGYSGFGTSLVAGGLQNAAAVEMWDRAQQDGKTSGEFTQTAGDGSQVSMQWNDSHASSPWMLAEYQACRAACRAK